MRTDNYLFPTLKRSDDRYSVFESRLRRLSEVSDRNENSLYSPSNSNKMLNCRDIQSMTNQRYLASGWTKSVFSADLRNNSYAVKTVYPEGKDVALCRETGYSFEECLSRASRKVAKEIDLLQKLSHSNIIKVSSEL